MRMLGTNALREEGIFNRVRANLLRRRASQEEVMHALTMTKTRSPRQATIESRTKRKTNILWKEQLIPFNFQRNVCRVNKHQRQLRKLHWVDTCHRMLRLDCRELKMSGTEFPEPKHNQRRRKQGMLTFKDLRYISPLASKCCCGAKRESRQSSRAPKETAEKRAFQNGLLRWIAKCILKERMIFKGLWTELRVQLAPSW